MGHDAAPSSTGTAPSSLLDPQGVDIGILGFDHVEFWVGNALQAAAYYISRFGFQPYAYRSLETGSRAVMTQVIKNGNVVFALSSPLEPNNKEFSDHLSRHGDGVRDVAFLVKDCVRAYDFAVKNGAKTYRPPTVMEDSHGTVIIATIEACYSGTLHSFVERAKYREGYFLPHYAPIVHHDDPLLSFAAMPEFVEIDHCVSNQADGMMEPVVRWYQQVLGFQRFWSVDDKQVLTKYSSLRSVVVTDPSNKVKMPINEPATGLRKSQIEEFVQYYGGAGIQHIALRTNSVLDTVTRLRKRGVNFITVPGTYYEDLKKRLTMQNSIQVAEDLTTVQKLGLLMDFDEQGYLLQIFTRPLQVRPTFFIEVLQRRSHDGFGVNNFKSLFEAIERDQALRGNL
mmetsp:Transcript_13555/g.23085  ORF Transcript_13555/g.23085 Transcript_13555/m.23085 type:complete len:397 (+) Transcript_13555:81-1271(+)|eukprot:CAMPEP_0184693736 /NCGR_PEP_ID=MMETSP0313-20130426/1898_1 /TAXON_ID=2792 /ORGANISM="Porphyridium aerugineum, Strain SAG 1380-2" /LENGTH=396 /DNA_ID=CAMNT_0027151893 /DNA_START=74 /DNA_END=1264 /DNA_ORIENTATION=-